MRRIQVSALVVACAVPLGAAQPAVTYLYELSVGSDDGAVSTVGFFSARTNTNGDCDSQFRTVDRCRAWSAFSATGLEMTNFSAQIVDSARTDYALGRELQIIFSIDDTSTTPRADTPRPVALLGRSAPASAPSARPKNLSHEIVVNLSPLMGRPGPIDPRMPMTCHFTSGPLAGSIFYFSGKPFLGGFSPVTMVGCTDGLSSYGYSVVTYAKPDQAIHNLASEK